VNEHLDAFERARLASAEKTIRRGLKTFVQVGEALLTIRDARLYRDTHDTFEAYCRAKWGLSKTHGNRLITAAQIVHELAPTGAVPTSERQVRELVPLLDEPGRMRRAWAAVVHRTGGKPTAKAVREVVTETIQTPAGPGSPPAPGPAGRGAPAVARGEARTAGDTPTRPPAAAQAGEGDGPAGGRAGRSVPGAPAKADREPHAGAPNPTQPDPQPVSPARGPESGGPGAPSSSSQVEGADGASPSAPPVAAPVAEGEDAWPEPILTGAEVHEALTDETSPLYLNDFGCRLALVHAAGGAPLDRAVVGAFRQSLGVA
jgi:hypothetical protein